LCVAYSQVIVKWRVTGLPGSHHTGLLKYLDCLPDPFILSAYAAGQIGSLVWLNAVAKLPLVQLDYRAQCAAHLPPTADDGTRVRPTHLSNLSFPRTV
jgi:hypothetical protein